MDIRPASGTELDDLATLWFEGWQDAHREILPPALKRAMSMPLKASLVSSWTGSWVPLNGMVLPAERADASKVSLLTGNFRFSSVLIISTP